MKLTIVGLIKTKRVRNVWMYQPTSDLTTTEDGVDYAARVAAAAGGGPELRQ